MADAAYIPSGLTDKQASVFQTLMQQPRDRRIFTISLMSMEDRAVFNKLWRIYARPNQLAPTVNPKTNKNDWMTWLLRAGRGFGKTRAGAGWIHERAMQVNGRMMALVARTPADARDFMIYGKGGIITNAPDYELPEYIVSARALYWPNGSKATIFSDEVPDQLRGFSGDTAWIDELAKFEHPQDTWDNLLFGMREKSTDQPRILITTTPRPLQIIRNIEQQEDTVVI